MMLNTAYLSLGSNINPAKNMLAAVKLLSEQTKLIASSSVWKTAAVGSTNQPDFLNAAVIVQTQLNPHQLKTEILTEIEQRLGRVKQLDKNAARTMDIDIILFNKQIFNLGQRHIPDAELLERAFVAIPMAEIAPDYQHPETGQALREIARTFTLNPNEMSLYSDLLLKLP